MSLTKEQLLIPRVMCVGGKEGEPNDTSGDFITGDILTQTEKRFSKWKSSKLKHTVYLDTSFIEKFPHLFRPMPWWEGRQPEDMPEYLIDKFGKVKRVLDYNTEFMTVVFSLDDFEESLAHYLPATEQEYKDYQKQNEGMVTCKEKGCDKPATKDYNGHGYFVCDAHYESLSNYFDEEYK